MAGSGHAAATVRTGYACADTGFHTVQAAAAVGTCFAYSRADITILRAERRIAQLQIGRRLADLGAAHHQTEMAGFDMLAAAFQTISHGRLQARVVTCGTGVYTGLHHGLHR